MNAGNEGAGFGPADPYGQPGYLPPGHYPSYDPVTGQQLPPGPPAYSAVDPYAGQPNVGQPYAGQPYAGQPYAGQPYAGQPYAGPPPGAYPPAYPGYAPVGYQMVPMYPTRPPKPGGAVAAAVLAFVQAGFVLIGSVFMFTGASVTDLGQGNRFSSEFTVVGIILLVVGGLLIAGGTTMLGRRSTLLAVSGLSSIALSVYFIIRLNDSAFGVAVWVPIVYAVLPILAIALSMGSDVRSWVRSPADSR